MQNPLRSSDRSEISTADSTSQDRKSAKGVWKSVALFYAIACGFAWIAWSPVFLGPDGLKLFKTAVSVPVFVCIGTLGPLVACFVIHRVQTGNWRAVRLLPPSRLQLCWVFLGPLLVLFCFFSVFPALISKGGPGDGTGI